MKAKKIIVFMLAFAFLSAACYSYLYSNAKHVNKNSKKESASADLIQKDDSIIYRMSNKYYIYKGNEVKTLDMKKAGLEITRKNQFF